MVDKDLFLHDLAAVAILKNEGPYLKEWIDYHLLAGVEHFYLYDNDSSDNQREVAAPYVKAGIVDYFSAPGKVMQMPVYNDAVNRFRFQCRYMALIDIDEFIFPKAHRGCIVDVVDEILSHDTDAAGLAINWQIFGSNGQNKADLSRGVLERFTRRAPSDWTAKFHGNAHVKTISNPRKIHYIYNPHCAKYFGSLYPVNENAQPVRGGMPNAFNEPVTAEKIVVNHYYIKSLEEFAQKQKRGRSDDPTKTYTMTLFEAYDRNEIFDDGILHYRNARAENFLLETDEHRFNRVTKALTENLSNCADLETALTCRALSTYLREHFPHDADCWRICEEASLTAVLKLLNRLSFAEAQLFIRVLPSLLRLPYPAVQDLRKAAEKIFCEVMTFMRHKVMWGDWAELDAMRDCLNLKEEYFC